MTGGTPSKPPGLSQRAGKLWRSVVSEYELAPAEVELLRCACEQLDRADEAARLVKRHGLVIADRYGSGKPHPAIEVERKARALFATLVKQLGIALDEEDESVGSRQARKASNARWEHARRARAQRSHLREVGADGS